MMKQNNELMTQVTDLIPYVRSGQLGSILDGLPAAAEYESLVDALLKGNSTEFGLDLFLYLGLTLNH